MYSTGPGAILLSHSLFLKCDFCILLIKEIILAQTQCILCPRATLCHSLFSVKIFWKCFTIILDKNTKPASKCFLFWWITHRGGRKILKPFRSRKYFTKIKIPAGGIWKYFSKGECSYLGSPKSICTLDTEDTG